jgi:hypothetical protein
MADRAFPGWLHEPSGEGTLDDLSLCYQHPGRLTGKLEITRCPEVCFVEAKFLEILFQSRP